jgi:dihydropyrimidinase
MWDVVVSGGTVVGPRGLADLDIAIQGTVVAAVGRDLGPSRRTIDGRGRIVLPGLVDPHVHLGIQHPFPDEVRTETAAALTSGVTTLGLFLRDLHNPYSPQLPAIKETYEANAYTDAFFHLQLFIEGHLEELHRDLGFGITSFKFYMCGLPGVIPSVDDGFLLAGFRGVAALGRTAIACVHAENQAIVDRASAEVRRVKGTGTLADWTASHPVEAEVEAIHRAALLARFAGCPLYVVHLSSALGLDAARSLKRGTPEVYLETTTPLLAVDNQNPVGLLAKLSPPVRTPADRESLWTGVRDGTIDTVGTDNISRSRAAKRAEDGLHGALTGTPGLATHLPILLDEGYHGRQIPLETIARVACEGPARVFGLYPRKGTIAPGSDADLVIVDLACERTVDAKSWHSFADFSIVEGRRLRGWPETIIKGGEVVVWQNELLVTPGVGRYLPRAAT